MDNQMKDDMKTAFIYGVVVLQHRYALQPPQESSIGGTALRGLGPPKASKSLSKEVSQPTLQIAKVSKARLSTVPALLHHPAVSG